MKAVVFEPNLVKPILKEMDEPVIKSDEVLIKVHAAALNHRDINITNPGNKQSFVYGSDGSGVIEKLGTESHDWQVGDEVVINSQISCMICKHCLEGEHSLCDSGRVLGGLSWNGTFAQYVKVPIRNIAKKPSHLTFEEAAALPLAFGTAWRTLFSMANLTPGETLFIHGIGGGVAIFCLQLAVSIGAKVYVTSSSNEKIKAAMQMGAFGGINYLEENIIERGKELSAGRGFDVIISSNGKVIPKSIHLAGRGGRIIQYAYIGEPISTFDIDLVMGKQLKLMGSSMHTYTDFVSGLKFVENTKMIPVVSDILPLEQFEMAFEIMKNSRQFGKIVLSMK